MPDPSLLAGLPLLLRTRRLAPGGEGPVLADARMMFRTAELAQRALLRSGARVRHGAG